MSNPDCEVSGQRAGKLAQRDCRYLVPHNRDAWCDSCKKFYETKPKFYKEEQDGTE